MKAVTFSVPALTDPKVFTLVKVLIGHPDVRQNKVVPKAEYSSGPPMIVPIMAPQDAKTLQCWFNVRDVVASEGGKAIFGWTLWTRDDGHYQAIHHAIWRSPDSSFIDVTPSELPATKTLFMPDARVPFDYIGHRVPASFLLLKDSTTDKPNYRWIDRDDQCYPGFLLERMMGEQ